MARVSTYLNFTGQTEDAFNFYKSVFSSDFEGQGFIRFSDIAEDEGRPLLADTELNLIMHVALPIIGGHVLMGSDITKSMEVKVLSGNNVNINLELDYRASTSRLFKALSAKGKIIMELQDVFWGAYFGSFMDKYGIQWRLTCTSNK